MHECGDATVIRHFFIKEKLVLSSNIEKMKKIYFSSIPLARSWKFEVIRIIRYVNNLRTLFINGHE